MLRYFLSKFVNMYLGLSRYVLLRQSTEFIHKNISTDILFHINRILIDYGLIKYYLVVLFFIGNITYLNYRETLIITTMNSSNYNNILTSFVLLNLTKMLVGVIKEQFQNKVFLPKFKNDSIIYLSKLMEYVDPAYLESQSEVRNIIPDGSSAIYNLGTNILEITEPLLTIFSSILALTNKVKLAALFVIFFGIVIFFTFGLLVLQYDYTGRKNNQKELNKNQDIVRNLWDSYLVYYLNGLGSNTIKDISSTSLKSEIIYRNHIATMSILYGSLHWIMYLLSSVTTYYIMRYNKYSSDNIQVFAMFYVVINSFNTTWWLFCTVRNALTSTASWSTIETFIENYKVRDIERLEELKDSLEVFEQFMNPECTELRLYAESGGGKTTWMLRKVVQLMNRYKSGWLYLDQRMRLPKDTRKIRQIMSDYIYTEINPTYFENKLCEYAKIIGIENIINKDTLDTCFNKPSGGEEKRILTLRGLLPILFGISNVKIVFNDEITAGLDDNNWLKVRNLIEFIKTNYGVKFVTIDHHEFTAQKLQVKKKTFNKTKLKVNTSNNNKNIITYLSGLFTSGLIKDEKENNKSILVWIDGMEEEPDISEETNLLEQIKSLNIEKSEIDKLLEIV